MKSSGIRSQAELARKAQVRPNTLTNWKSGKTERPRKNDMEAVAGSLGVSTEWLLTGSGPMKAEGAAEVSASYQADPGLDLQALTLAIETLEAFLAQHRKKLAPAAKAQTVAQLYATMRLWRPEALTAANVTPLLAGLLAG